MTFYAKAVRDKGSLAKEDSFIELRLPAQGIKRQGCLIAPLRSYLQVPADQFYEL